MPSLFDEGRGKGFDVAVGLWGWTLFAQFKRGWKLTRSTALEWPIYNVPYHRFEIYPPARSTQHKDLLALEASAPIHWVAYVAPAFHTNAELNMLFIKRQILSNIRMTSPRAVGTLADQTHRVTYRTTADAPILHSEPRSIVALDIDELEARIRQTDWSAEVNGANEGDTLSPIVPSY